MKTKKLRVGIIGAGQVADTAHIPAYAGRCDEVEVVALCDIRKENAVSLSDKYGIPEVYSSHTDMLEQAGLDAVSVCVGNRWHSSITMDALKAGCHVLCEKPPALNAGQAREMRRTAEVSGKVLTYNLSYRFSPQADTFRELIASGRMGKIYACKVQALRRRGIPGWGSFTNKEVQGGGALIDLGIHFLDLALYLMGYPKVRYVCANAFNAIGKRSGIGLMGSWDPEAFTVEDSLFGYLQLENGTTIHLETAFAINMKPERKMNVLFYGDKAGGSLFPAELYTEECNQLADISFPFIGQTGNNHDRSIRHFVECCMGRAEPLITPTEGESLQRVIDALYRSVEAASPIELI